MPSSRSTSHLPFIAAILFFVAMLVVAGIGITKIKLDGDGGSILPMDIPEVQGLTLFRSAFGKREEIILTVRASSPEKAREASREIRAHLLAHPDVAAAVNDPELLIRELAAGNVLDLPPEIREAGAALIAFAWLNGSDEKLATLEQRFSDEGLTQRFEEVIETLQFGDVEDALKLQADPLGFLDILPKNEGNETMGIGPNTSSDGRYRVLGVRSPDTRITGEEAVAWLDKVTALVEEWNQSRTASGAYPVKIKLTGEPRYMKETLGGMQRDLGQSVVTTLILIMILFAVIQRRMKALAWLMLALVTVFFITLGFAGWIFTSMSVLSVGFAAILLGLAVDYGMVIYGESLTERREEGVRELWKGVGPSVLWAAATTTAVFFSLNFSSIPGIAQLGDLVGLGIVISATVMLGGFAYICSKLKPGRTQTSNPWRHVRTGGSSRLWATPLVAFAALSVIVIADMPGIDKDFRVLRPRHSEALNAFEEMRAELSPDNAPKIAYVVNGNSPQDLWKNRQTAQEGITEITATEDVANYFLAGDQVERIREILAQRDRVLSKLRDTELFEEEPIALVEAIFKGWDTMLNFRPEGFETGGMMNRSGLDRVFAVHGDNQSALLGWIEVADRDRFQALDFSWSDKIQGRGGYLAGWEPVGPAVLRVVGQDFQRIFTPLAVVMLVMLIIVFRDWRDIVLAIGLMVLSGITLLAVMRLLGLRWNFINLCAIPLLFGTGLDYIIHMIFSLRRSGGHMPTIRRGIRKALLFCALSTAAGFGSLAMAGNMGIASLGRVCAVGILLIMVFAIYILPVWWLFLHKERLKGMGGTTPSKNT